MHSGFIIESIDPDFTPGPAGYVVDQTWTPRNASSPSPRINSSPRKLLGEAALQPQIRMQSPGPDEYRAAAAWHDRDWDKKAKFSSLAPRNPAQMLSTSTSMLCRGGFIIHDLDRSQKDELPGPGTYHQGPAESPAGRQFGRSKSASTLTPSHSSPVSPPSASAPRRSVGEAGRRQGYLQATVSSKGKEKIWAARISKGGAPPRTSQHIASPLSSRPRPPAPLAAFTGGASCDATSAGDVQDSVVAEAAANAETVDRDTRQLTEGVRGALDRRPTVTL